MTPQPSQIRVLRELLDEHRGRENAVTLAEIARELNWTRREVEQVLHELRSRCGLYCSCAYGIYRATRRDELTAYRLQLKSRLDEIAGTLRAVERELNGPTQIPLMEL